MWRFAVYTHKTSILSKTCLNSVRQALKHTDGRADHFRFASNDAASTMRMEKDQPIREVFSLDDFGLLSVNRSQSIESMSSAGSEHTFLEQLFRNDTLTTFSNVQIPTTEVFKYDYVSELLGEGVVAEELVEELAEELVEASVAVESSESMDLAAYHDDQQPSTSGSSETGLPFLIPQLPSVEGETRKVLTEKMRRERKSMLNLSTTTATPTEDVTNQLFHVPEAFKVQNLGEMLYPDSLPVESYSSQWKEGEQPVVKASEAVRAPEVVHESAEFSLEVLEGIASEGTLAELHKELEAVGFVWPDYLFTGDWRMAGRTARILRFVAEKSQNYQEAQQIVEKFAHSHMRAVIPDDVILHLTAKSIAADSSTIPSILSQLESLSSLALSRELRPSRQLVEQHLTTLYTAAIQKCSKSSASLLTLCSQLNFDRSAELFMRCFAEQRAAAPKGLEEWKKLSTKYGSLQGIDSFWLEALKDQRNGVEKRINALLAHSGKSEHPFSTMARLICAFVKLDELDKALEIFRTVSVSGRHFRGPLAAFVETKDLASIERLAVLIERGMIAERRRSARTGVNKNGEAGEKPASLLGDDFHAVLAKFYGVGGERRQKKKKYVDLKAKRKIHRVDEEQLHELCVAIQKAWIQCADTVESVKRLVEWCTANRIEIDENVQKLIDKKNSL